MKKLRYKKILMIIVLMVFSEMTLIQVHASELELKPKTYNESNPYKLKVSYTWTSEGQTIQSYDVSDNGQIAIAFSNQTIGVFDNDMNFLYQLSFINNGSYGVLWLDESLLFIDHRSKTAVVFGNDGVPENFYEITGPSNYYYEVVQERIRKQGNDRYYCTNGSEGNISLVHYAYYTILKRTSGEGKEEILYEVDTLFDGTFGAKLYIVAYPSIYVMSAIGVLIYKIYKRHNKR